MLTLKLFTSSDKAYFLGKSKVLPMFCKHSQVHSQGSLPPSLPVVPLPQPQEMPRALPIHRTLSCLRAFELSVPD